MGVVQTEVRPLHRRQLQIVVAEYIRPPVWSARSDGDNDDLAARQRVVSTRDRGRVPFIL